MNRKVSIMTGCISVAAVAFAGELQQRKWMVDDVPRKALIHMPERSRPAPLVFVFHGHGGNMKGAARQFRIHELWPEAIVVYMQGLPTPVKKFDPEGKRSGWQIFPRDQEDRDLRFVDVVTAALDGRFLTDRVYCTGHSNGGRFTCLLWAERGDLFAAVAASGSPNELPIEAFDPKPAMHIAGEKDGQYALQEKAMKKARKINGCSTEGKSWYAESGITGTIYPSDVGTPFVSLIYPGGHKPPPDMPELVVRFFKEQHRE